MPFHGHTLPDATLDDIAGLGFPQADTAFSSPAMPPIFDVASTMSSTTIGTVSPQDLLVHEPFMSAPNSTALTALTSPSTYNGSPDFNDAFNMSPCFVGSDLEGGTSDPWFPLFPQDGPSEMTGDGEGTSHEETHATLVAGRVENAPKKRKSRGASAGQHSSVSGVGSRRRDKPLPPIIVEDPSDVVAMKRARNTLAARKSRERKAQRVEELEERIQKLERERDYWKRLAQGHQVG